MRLFKLFVFIILLQDSFVRAKKRKKISKTKTVQQPVLSSQQIQTCCNSIDNWSSLLHCVKLASSNNIKKVSESTVGIVTYASRNIQDYASYSFAINEAYAEHHRYVMHFFEINKYELTDERWSKVKILAEALDQNTGWARKLKYIVWIDADASFLDMNFKIDELAAQYPRANLLVSAENKGGNSRINSGVMIFRCRTCIQSFLSFFSLL